MVYVDNDPIVLAHARALLTSTPQGRSAYIDADLCKPDTILGAPEGGQGSRPGHRAPQTR